MSTELFNQDDVSVTQLFGGTFIGRCYQITQHAPEFSGDQYITLTPHQLKILAMKLAEITGADPTAPTILANDF